MRTILVTLSLATTLAISFAAPGIIHAQPTPAQLSSDRDPIYLQEIKIRNAIHNHDLAAVGALMAPGFLEVEDTISTRDQILGFITSCTVNNYAIHSHQTRMLSPTIAMIIYSVHMDITCGKDHEAGDFNDTTTWTRTPDTGKGPGRWLAQVHTNAPAAKP